MSLTSSTTTSGSASSTTSLFSQTFSPPPPPPSSTSTGTSSPSVASSASLYLYTFLATLVLLLSVSAAIILRSLLLRRRHRRMVEEAIRNGTWVPPSPGGLGFGFGGRSGGGRIDPGKQPKMWDTYVEKKEDTKGYAETEWYWDSIRPFAASVVTPTTSPSQPSPQLAEPAVTTNLATSATTRERPSFMPRIRQYISPTPPTFPPSPPEPNVPRNNDSPSLNNVLENGLPSGPQTVRVSVIIAMPSPPRSQSPSHTASTSKSPSPHLTSPSPIPIAPESTPLGIHTQSRRENEDETLPYFEFGVAELVVGEQSKEREVDSRADPRGAVDGKRPLSMGSSLV